MRNIHRSKSNTCTDFFSQTAKSWATPELESVPTHNPFTAASAVIALLTQLRLHLPHFHLKWNWYFCFRKLSPAFQTAPGKLPVLLLEQWGILFLSNRKELAADADFFNLNATKHVFIAGIIGGSRLFPHYVWDILFSGIWTLSLHGTKE